MLSSWKKFLFLSATLAVVNATGLIWIRSSLLAAQQPTPSNESSGEALPDAEPPTLDTSLRIVDIAPKHVIDRADRFSVTFSDDVSPESNTRTPLADAPFTVTPPVPGHWEWASRRRLDYVLERRLSLGRTYTLSCTEGAVLCDRTIADAVTHEYHTTELVVKSVRLDSYDREHVGILVAFNQPVLPEDVIAHATVRSDTGHTLVATSTAPEASERITLTVPRDNTSSLSVRIRSGLKPHRAERGLRSTYSTRLTIAQAFALLDPRVPGVTTETNISVRVPLSTELDPSQEAPTVSFDPAVEGALVSLNRRSLVLTGRFVSGQRYRATVDGILVSKDGQTLTRERVSFTVPGRTPTIRFTHGKGVLMPSGNMTLKLEAVNVPAITFEAWRVYESNVLSHARGQSPSWTSRRTAEKTFALEQQRDRPRTIAVELDEFLPEPMGTYRINARSTGTSWVSDSCVVVITDLGLTVKCTADGAVAWVTSLATGKPLRGVRVTARSGQNQVLTSAPTDADGIAKLNVSANHPDGPLWLVTAQAGEDLNYIAPERHRLAVSGTTLSGSATPTTYDVMLYTERGVYRPGDTMHLAGIVRDAVGGTPEPFPISLCLIRPDGRTAREFVAKPGARQGEFALSVPTTEDFLTGRYRITATLPGSDAVLGCTYALIETVVPVRIEVNATPSKSRYAPGEVPRLDVGAKYLFGRPASKLPLKVLGSYVAAPVATTAFPGYRFAPSERPGRAQIKVQSHRLDEAGASSIDLPAAVPAKPGYWRVDLSATVTEEGGRSVSDNRSVYVDTAGRHVGVKIDPKADKGVAVEWVVVDGAGALAPEGDVSVSLERVWYESYREKVNRNWAWKYRRAGESVFEEKRSGNRGEVALPQVDCGRFCVTVRDESAGTDSSVEFYTYHGRVSYGSHRQQPDALTIHLDRKTYEPGMRGTAMVRSPFAGTLFFCIETGEVLAHRVITCGAEQEVAFTVPTSVRGGAFIAASMVRAIDPAEKDWLSHRAFGVVRLPTAHARNRVTVQVESPARTRPASMVEVKVSTGTRGEQDPPALAHVWAVDEGLLLPTHFRTPDPHAHFFAHRRAMTETADVYGELIPDVALPTRIDRIGAGAARRRANYQHELARLRRGMSATRSAPTVVWNEFVELGSDGTARVPFSIPDYTGRVRFMAVVVDRDYYGCAQASTTVSSPFLVETTVPRAAAPGDRFTVPVKVFNNTGSPTDVWISLESRGQVTLDTAGEVRMRVDPDAPAVLWCALSAKGLGEATFAVTARGMTPAGGMEEVCISPRLMVRPPSPPHVSVRAFNHTIGTDLRIDPPTGFLEGTATTTMSIGASPLVDVAPAVKALIAYPYGCVEQTSSRLYALVYAPHLLDKADAREGRRGGGRSRRVTDMVNAGIDRLMSMQTPSGGIGYWPNATQPHMWGTAYASFLLLQARNAGYEIDKGFAKSLVEFMRTKLGPTGQSRLDANTRALYCHVLAGFGRPHHGWMARLTETADQLDMAGRANLAGAWHHAGRSDHVTDALPQDTIDLSTTLTTGGRITSQVRQEALLLLVLLEIDPAHAWIPTLVDRVRDARENSCWGSTVENATALAALARYQATQDTDAHFAGTVSTPGGQATPVADDEPRTLSYAETGETVTLTAEGTGICRVTCVTEGIGDHGNTPQYDQGLKVRRRYTDRRGDEVDPTALRVGDLLFAEVEIELHGPRRPYAIHNVAIVDLLPGGFEIENPRLATSAHSPMKQRLGADHIELLDDRVVLFTSVTRRTRRFRYGLRVTTAGTFIVPPVQASCMYDAKLASIHGGGTAVIRTYGDTAKTAARE
jgi:uncharacterized protein YfaS (alpha-2-macroglobulin family)